MRIDILAIGSRGDVQPCVALGVGLRRRGHHARVVTLSGFDELVCRHGLAHLAIGGSVSSIAETAEGRDWIKRRRNPLGFLRGFVRVAQALIEESIASYWNAREDVDAIVVTPMGLMTGASMAERLGVPLIQTHYAPIVWTHYDFAGHKNPLTALQGDWRELQHLIYRRLLWSQVREATNRARERILHLAPARTHDPVRDLRAQRTLQLDAYSEVVVQRPADWGNWVQVTGYWFLDEEDGWAPAPELTDFLESGQAPVCIGFGSTPLPEPEATVGIVLQGLRQARQRGIVLAGGSGLPTGRLSDDVLSVDSVPHRWLFSRVCAAVHHGGAGVTGAALRAGLPSVVVPVFGDQPFWGRRVYSLGAGPRPIPAARLTAGALADAIQLTASPEMRHRAAALGERIRPEEGVQRAVDVIQEYLRAALPPRRVSMAS